MILEKVDFRTRRPVAPVVAAPPLPEGPARSAADGPGNIPETPKPTGGACPAIYSKRLKTTLYPYKDPYTGRIVAVVTEAGERLTEADIEAFRLIDIVFGIESIERLTRGAE
jgi:hypothetical protein